VGWHVRCPTSTDGDHGHVAPLDGAGAG
jgi:hypothetical protein